MTLNTSSIEFLLLCIAVLALLLLVGYVITEKTREKRKKKNIVAISDVLVDYFQRTGVHVRVGCTQTGNSNRYTAFVESEPMKRFRLSHIIEMTLRDHVAKACGLELDKIYWRFPIKKVEQQAAGSPNTQTRVPSPEGEDDYINEGLVNYRHLPKVDVTELSWESFEAATSQDFENTQKGDEEKSSMPPSTPDRA